MRNNIFDKVLKKSEELLQNESSGHDIYHAVRVYKNAMHIQGIEGGDEQVVGIAAIVHDICRPWEKRTGKSHFGDEALEIIKKMLNDLEIDQSRVQKIIEIVRDHDVYDWTNKINNKSIELQIVQDADNLDAIGAIGIARTFAFGGANGLTMYSPGESFTYEKDFVEDPNHRTSTIGHFYEKLLKLKDNMNTQTGKKIAQERHKVMENFLSQFFDEWECRFK